MDSSNNNANGLSACPGKISDESLSRDGSGTHSELERVKMHLQQATKKNQDLKEMLLFTTQELEKERENSRRIVLILTERVMESREIINKLEVENMRYKKDCVLAVELLQCNKSVDQGRVLSTIKKLSDHASKPQASQNSYQNRTGTISTTENQLTMLNINEIPSKETKVFQKPSKTTDEKTRNDTKDVENVKTALFREEKPIENSNMKGEQLVSNKQRSSVRDKTSSAEKESLLTQGEDFVEDTPSLSPSGRPNVYKKMPEDDVSATEEDKQYVGENKTQLSEDDRVLVKEDESFANQKTFLQENGTPGPLTSSREPLPQKNKTVTKENNMATKEKPLQTEIKSSLTDGDTKLAKEKPSMKDGEYLAKGDAPQGQDRESLQDTSIIQDNTTTTRDDSLADDNKSMENDDSPLEEQEKRLIPEAKQSGGALLEKSSSLEINTPASKVPSLDENSLAEKSKLLANGNEALAENEKCLVKDSPPPTTTKEVKAKSSVCQDDTPSTEKNSMHEDKDTSKDKETEDDTFLAEEDTPLV